MSALWPMGPAFVFAGLPDHVHRPHDIRTAELAVAWELLPWKLLGL